MSGNGAEVVLQRSRTAGRGPSPACGEALLSDATWVGGAVWPSAERLRPRSGGRVVPGEVRAGACRDTADAGGGDLGTSTLPSTRRLLRRGYSGRRVPRGWPLDQRCYLGTSAPSSRLLRASPSSRLVTRSALLSRHAGSFVAAAQGGAFLAVGYSISVASSASPFVAVANDVFPVFGGRVVPGEVRAWHVSRLRSAEREADTPTSPL